MTRATLAEIDGLSLKNTKRMPHPVDLSRWSDAGYIRIDLDDDCFRLTPSGRLASKSFAGQSNVEAA